MKKVAWGVVASSICMMSLTGCKTEISTYVSLNNLNSQEFYETSGVAKVEVTTCDDFNDSRIPSDSLVRAQEMMSEIIPRSEFIECYKQGFDDWAEFSMPISVGLENEDTINLISLADSDGSLYLMFPDRVNQAIDDATNSRPSTRDLDISMSINLVNDTGEMRRLLAVGAWADNKPLVSGYIDLPPRRSVELRLSDVTIAAARKNGVSPVILRGE